MNKKLELFLKLVLPTSIIAIFALIFFEGVDENCLALATGLGGLGCGFERLHQNFIALIVAPLVLWIPLLAFSYVAGVKNKTVLGQAFLLTVVFSLAAFITGIFTSTQMAVFSALVSVYIGALLVVSVKPSSS